jgi:tetratricopeptide (TPR) repeat protein
MRFGLKIVILAACLAAAQPALAQQSTGPSDEEIGNFALAERVCQIAQISLLGGTIEPATLHQTAALLEIACRLNPNEPRFLRLLTEAYLQLGGREGREGATSSLTRYLKLVPSDLGAWVTMIDLNSSQMETADAKKKYLDQLIGDDRISAEVRSSVAVQAAGLAMERGETEQCGQYTDQALKFMPLNPSALRMKYAQLTADATVTQRVELLLMALRSNPAQPWATASLADALADAGLVDPAILWYQKTFDMLQRMYTQGDIKLANNYASELVIADQLAVADTFVRRITDSDPTNSVAATLALLIDKRSGSADKIQASTDKLRAALQTRLSRISDHLNNRAPSTTQPSTTEPSTDVDIPGDVKKLLANGADELNRVVSADYAAGLGELAWLEIYFNNKPADAEQYMSALRQLVPADDPVVARLEGWSLLVDGKAAEAKVKLSAVADREPLAALGMLRAENEFSPAQATAISRRLLSRHASGLVGAILIEGLRDKVGLMPPGPDAQTIRDLLEKFPKDWLDFLDFSKVKNFYLLKADPDRVAHAYNVAMLMTVTVQNISDYDLTVGPEGAIKPDLWFDVNIRGLSQQNIQGVAFDRLTSHMILHPRESTSVTLRVDQGPLLAALQGNPAIEQPLYFSVVTNPMTLPSGITPGPGGYRTTAKVVVRSSSPLSPASLQTWYNQILSGPADVRMRTLELLGNYANAMRRAEQPEAKAKSSELVDMIRKCTGDPVPAVRSQAMIVTGILAEESLREGFVRQLMTANTFVERAGGLIAAAQLVPPDKRKELVRPVAEDKSADPLLRKMAAAEIEVAELPPPATQPTTEPSDQFAAPPPGGMP